MQSRRCKFPKAHANNPFDRERKQIFRARNPISNPKYNTEKKENVYHDDVFSKSNCPFLSQIF